MDIQFTLESFQSLTKFKIPRFTRTLSQWVNTLVQAGFIIEQMNEPQPSNETALQHPALQDTQIIAYFLHFRCRKPD